MYKHSTKIYAFTKFYNHQKKQNLNQNIENQKLGENKQKCRKQKMWENE
jgi:hypothetical protein